MYVFDQELRIHDNVFDLEMVQSMKVPDSSSANLSTADDVPQQLAYSVPKVY